MLRNSDSRNSTRRARSGPEQVQVQEEGAVGLRPMVETTKLESCLEAGALGVRVTRCLEV